MGFKFRHFLAVYAITAGVFLLIDVLWLGKVASGFYTQLLGDLLREEVRWGAAAAFYGIYIGGLLVFVIVPALRTGAGVEKTALMGGLLGLFAYSTFDLTALALIRGWSVAATIVDIAWGTVLTAASTTLSYMSARAIIVPNPSPQDVT